MVSVIVPVYNTSEYLEDCINSVINQDFLDFELILVDDGSTDNSLVICKKFACLYSERIKVLHQENKGVTAARKLGIEYSNGDYICFIDSDDTIEKEYLSFLMSKMSAGIDIVTTWERVEQTISGEEYLKRLLEKKTTLALWGKLYRKELIVNSGALDVPRSIYIGEDYLANIRIALLAKNIVCTSAGIYRYRDNLRSVWRTRKVSFSYENMFRDEVEKVVDKQIVKYQYSWFKFQVNILYELIINKVRFSNDCEWITSLYINKSNYNLSVRDRVLLLVRNRVLCRWILLLLLKVNKWKNILCSFCKYLKI